MGSRPAANLRYLKSGQLASFFSVFCFLLLPFAASGVNNKIFTFILKLNRCDCWDDFWDDMVAYLDNHGKYHKHKGNLSKNLSNRFPKRLTRRWDMALTDTG
jgi:hypothetical protein